MVWSGPKGLMLQVLKIKACLEEEKHLFEHQGGWNIEVGFFRSNGLPVFISDRQSRHQTMVIYF